MAREFLVVEQRPAEDQQVLQRQAQTVGRQPLPDAGHWDGIGNLVFGSAPSEFIAPVEGGRGEVEVVLPHHTDAQRPGHAVQRTPLGALHTVHATVRVGHRQLHLLEHHVDVRPGHFAVGWFEAGVLRELRGEHLVGEVAQRLTQVGSDGCLRHKICVQGGEDGIVDVSGVDIDVGRVLRSHPVGLLEHLAQGGAQVVAHALQLRAGLRAVLRGQVCGVFVKRRAITAQQVLQLHKAAEVVHTGGGEEPRDPGHRPGL